MHNKVRYQYIDSPVESTEKDWAWNYFVTQTMQLALALLGEAIPGSTVGLILPLQRKRMLTTLHLPEDLPKLGRSLVGWLENRSLQVFLASPPQFTYADDHRIERLSREHGLISKDDPLLVVPRQADPFSIESGIVETVRLLLDFVYQYQESWYSSFQRRVSSFFTPVNRSHSGLFSPDALLNNLMDIIIQLGGTTRDGQNRWRFCCVLQPQEPRLPLQQHNLFVYAQSKNAPHKVGTTVVYAGKEPLCLSLRAYLSPHIHYIENVAPKDTTIDFQEVEEPIHSAVALPIDGEQGVAHGVLYVTSDETDAFPQTSRTLLRLMCKMVGNLLTSYRIQQKSSEHLIDIVRQPDIVDWSFEHFLSENDFRQSVRALLEEILENERQEQHSNEEISFIAIGMDKLDHFAPRYGSYTLRNLHREMGSRIEGSARTWFTRYQLYHIYADKFYLLFKGLTVEQVQTQVMHLKGTLDGSYRIDAQYISADQFVLPGQKLLLEDITVRLAFTSYTKGKLLEFLHQHEEDVNTVSLKMRSTLEDALKKGEDEGGNTIIGWSREQGMFSPLLAARDKK